MAKFAEIIKKESERSELGDSQWRSGNVISYIHMIAESYRQTAHQRDIELVFSPNENNITIPFIPDYLYKIMRNLIGNSLKFTPAGGHIYISTSLVDNHFRIRVADNGIGISRDDLPHIFEPFYQGSSDATMPGSGIGLSLVSQMVKAMNGTISVKSVAGNGSVFTILLPLEHAGEIKPLNDSLSPSDTGETLVADPEQLLIAGNDKPVILVVEDNNSVAYYIGKMLADSYLVYYAYNGREGFEKAKALVPDVIITDLMMPEMDGFDMTAQIRANGIVNHVPIIAITAKAEESDKIRGLETGMDAYLTKPFNKEELTVRVQKLIEQRNLLREKYQRVMQSGAFESPDMTLNDRKFLSLVVDTIYAMMSAGKPTDIESIASKLGVSRNAFTRKVQAVTGDTTLLYINKIKISKAKSMLDADPNGSVSDVAYACGFDDPNYFSRIFKQIEGITPTQYRNRVK